MSRQICGRCPAFVCRALAERVRSYALLQHAQTPRARPRRKWFGETAFDRL